jgi:hypothetical protein
MSGWMLSSHCVATLPKYNSVPKLVVMLYDCEENSEAWSSLIRGNAQFQSSGKTQKIKRGG